MSECVTSIISLDLSAAGTGGAFEKSPSSLNVTVGTMAEFTCTSPTAITFAWLVNGSDVEPENAENFTPEGGGRGTRLKIEAMSATTNTTIQCVAVILRGPQHFSDVAILMVQGECIFYVTRTCLYCKGAVG